MAEYQLTSTDMVIRTEDMTYIPADPANMAYAEYLEWVDDGGVPDPNVAPPLAPPEPTQAQQNAILLDHENRLRVMAGDAPLTMKDFTAKMVKL